MGAFVISKRLSGDYKFEYTSRKGKTIFTSNAFEFRFECEENIEYIKNNIQNAVFMKFKSTSGKFYFKIIVYDKEVASSRKFTTSLLMQKSIDEIYKYALLAEILDFTVSESLIFE